MSVADDIHIRREDKAGRITLARPKALNALTYDMVLAMEAALTEWRADDAVSLVIVDAEGERAFCAGGDIQRLYDTGIAGDFEFGRKFWADEYRLNAMIANYPKPYVAMIDGIVMGGGFGVSVHGSHRIVGERALFAMPECAVGLVPDVGGNFWLARASGHVGEFLAMTGARLGPADMIWAGFADALVPSEAFPDLISTLQRTGDARGIEDFDSEPEQGTLSGAGDMIDRHFAGPDAVSIVTSLEADSSEWAAKQAKAIRRGCPLSVACALELVRRSRSLQSVEQVLAAEYRFTYRSMSDGEFLEGIRAQIIDKDRDPRWKTPDLESLTSETISAMLAGLGEHELRLPAAQGEAKKEHA